MIATLTGLTCSVCGEPLDTKTDCLVCLLRGGLTESDESDGSLGFGDFEIVQCEDGSLWELGSGAMGVTYRARDKVLHRLVALKVVEIPSTNGNAEVVRARFLREARTAAALKHPNVASIFQFGATPESDRCYYAMELVEGETLEALVRRDGPLAPHRALDLSIQIARALVAAAAQGLIHRDLKPGNIMIVRLESSAMEVKVIDFGLAKTMNAVAEADLTHGSFIGTPAFASPEQFAGASADARSDIYSLGATLWYALIGEVPYPGKTIAEIQRSQKTRPLPLEQLTQRKTPACLIQLLQRLLDQNPAGRPGSARELLGQLETCRARTHSSARRKRRALIAALILLLGTISVFFLRGKIPPASPSENLGANDNELPTSDLTAYALYNEAKTLSRRTDLNEWSHKNPRVIELLHQAIERDPKFVLAYCSLAEVYSQLHSDAVHAGKDSESVDRLWREAIDHAMQLHPNMGDPHLAFARYDLFLNRFEAARNEIAIVRRLLPNNPDGLFFEARIDRRQNHWDDSLAEARRAYELDPQNGEIIEWLCEDYRLMRRFAEGERFAYQAMKRKPEFTSSLYADIAEMKLAEGEPEAAREILTRLSPAIGIETRFQTALYLRDYNSAAQIIATTPAEQADNFFDGKPPFSCANGEVNRDRGDESAARAAFRGARALWENADGRRDEFYFMSVAQMDAGLGRKEEAIHEAQRAVELVPIESDPLFGGDMVGRLAKVYAWTGEPARAIEKLEMLAKIPGSVSYGDLRFNPGWDSLRNQPRFQKLLAGLEPKKLDH
ncbi:MAG TPA: protein kinase [Chthoniobacterales bacterium]|nr:protein kinase [Chthoniobacterales bacterium]